jgi:ankyrin repeat protein
MSIPDGFSSFALREGLSAGARRGDLEQCRKWIARGARIDELDGWGSLLHNAIQSDDERKVVTLLAVGADVEAEMRKGGTALHAAAAWGRSRICSILLAAGARIDAPSSGDGETALHKASGAAETKDTLAVLLKGGANVHAHDNDGMLPLHHATEFDNVAACRLLVAAGANPAEPPVAPAELTPFQSAVHYGAVDAVAYFVADCGQDPNQLTGSGKTMFELAREGSEPRVMRELLAVLQTEWAVRGALSNVPAAPQRGRDTLAL